MEAYPWDRQYLVGVEEIDAQHRHLFALLHGVRFALCEGASPEGVEEKIMEMCKYCEEHFSTEEAYMLPYKDKLENLADHLVQHKDFIITSANFLLRFDKEGAELTQEMFDYLGRWLVQHIGMMDRKTFDTLRALGAPVFDE